jgi:putative phosphoesterase
MKLLVFSDNHGDTISVDRLISAHPDADRLISLGDSQMTELALSARNVFGVRGNYPFEPDFPDELVFEYEGHRTLIVHGHRYYVKTGTYYLVTAAIEQHCDLVLFGHTHQWVATQHDGVFLVNPGSSLLPKGGGKQTYALVTVTPHLITAEIMDVQALSPIFIYTKTY